MAIKSNEYLTNLDFAQKINSSPRTTERWRIEGKGPKFYKFGSKVLYAVSDGDKWIAEQQQASTSSPNKA